MRNKRSERLRRHRRQKIRNFFIFTLILPLTLITAGYIVASLFILPAINK